MSHNPTCPDCGGPSFPLGSMGSLSYYRCRDCGWTMAESSAPEPSAWDRRNLDMMDESELTELTETDQRLLAQAASDEGLDLDAKTLAPLSYAGMLALQASIEPIPNRPSMTAHFRETIHREWARAQRAR